MGEQKMWWDTRYRCVEGRKMRHAPQPDDPDLEMDMGQCEDCDGEGCDIKAATPDDGEG